MLWRLLTLIRQQAHGAQLLLQRAKARDITSDESLTNLIAPRLARLHPVAHVTTSGKLTLNHKLIKQLNEAQINHNESPIVNDG